MDDMGRNGHEIEEGKFAVIKYFLTIVFSVYFGAGLSLGLVMQQVLPLNNFGVVVYALTWPRHVYCARPGSDCFGHAAYLPDWFGRMLFNLEEPIADDK